ncbi:MAG: hypothetical protein FWD71_15770 [Oscillospiraceae bacterium]|nr:hypothetical protein [Oscillospiraceae bacterium]
MKNRNLYIKFEPDEKIIGRWQMLGVVEKKEDYSPGKKLLLRGAWHGDRYFLPNGKGHGMIAWTRNYVMMERNAGYVFCHYETKEIDGELYMFLDRIEKAILDSIYPKYNTHEGVIILKQTDKKRYTMDEICVCS